MIYRDSQEPQKEEEPGDQSTSWGFKTAGARIKFICKLLYWFNPIQLLITHDTQSGSELKSAS